MKKIAARCLGMMALAAGLAGCGEGSANTAAASPEAAKTASVQLKEMHGLPKPQRGSNAKSAADLMRSMGK